ncbi:MAG: hypothetical protein K9L17_14160 [Clostridiales bacterium]|nr:hypothetical protein [Clostridiales bacterium]MCF8023814.1 hypothetical protein [Clostridiales bacterium]
MYKAIIIKSKEDNKIEQIAKYCEENDLTYHVATQEPDDYDRQRFDYLLNRLAFLLKANIRDCKSKNYTRRYLR